MKVLCIDDRNRPEEVPATHWVKKGEEYNIIRVCKLNIQGLLGVQLAEIDLSPFEPYIYFDSARFVPFDYTLSDLLGEREIEIIQDNNERI